jgi:hypothetical protein
MIGCETLFGSPDIKKAARMHYYANPAGWHILYSEKRNPCNEEPQTPDVEVVKAFPTDSKQDGRFKQLLKEIHRLVGLHRDGQYRRIRAKASRF